MNRVLVVRPDAEEDIADAALWYQTRRSGLGDEFVVEVRDALKRALKNPNHYRRLRRRPEVRRVLTNRFPYRVFFIVQPKEIIVFRVLHGARHDREWKRSV